MQLKDSSSSKLKPQICIWKITIRLVNKTLWSKSVIFIFVPQKNKGNNRRKRLKEGYNYLRHSFVLLFTATFQFWILGTSVHHVICISALPWKIDDKLGFQTAPAYFVEFVILCLLGMHQPTVMEGEGGNGKGDLSALCSIGIKVHFEFPL